MLAEALNSIRETLLVEGYMLMFDQPSEDVINITIMAGPDACEDCLVPKPILEEMIKKELSDHGISYTQLNLRLPVDLM